MEERRKTSAAVTWLGAVAVILFAAAGGLYVGGLFKDGNEVAAQPVEQFDVFAELSLAVGNPFPDIMLHDLQYHERSSRNILHQDGTVILFMEPNCPPCHSLAIEWKEAIDEGTIGADQVVGISYSDAARLEQALANYDITFRYYADPHYAFMDQYGVDGFPLLVVVNKSGTITYVDTNSDAKIAPDRLAALLYP